MNKENLVQNIMGEVVTNAINTANSNSVCGQPFVQDGFTFIPVNKVSVNYAAGGGNVSQNGGGANVNLIPMSFLVVKDSKVKTVSIKSENQNATALAELIIDTAKEVFKKQRG